MAKLGTILIGCAVAAAAVVLVGPRVPAVQDRLFETALKRQLSPRSAALLETDGLGVFFCGTGSPLPSAKRAQTCTAVFAGGRFWLVDSGTGSWETVQAAGIPADRLAGVFLTHFHSDHIGDLGEANLGSWVAGRDAPLTVHGPEGVERIVAGLNDAYSFDNAYRTAHHGKAVAEPRTAGLVAVPFPTEGGVVLEADGLRVTAFAVRHDPVVPAVGYRFDYKGRSIAISGDAAPSPSLVAAAKGVDVLIHEAQANHMVATMERAAAERGNARLAKIFADIPSYHTSPADAARLAEEAGAQRLVLSHLTPAPDNRIARSLFLRGMDGAMKGRVSIAEDRDALILPADGGVVAERY